MKSKRLRSHAWFSGLGRDAFVHRAYLKSEGFSENVFDGRPVIGICNSWSELTTCNLHLRQVAQVVKRGVLQAGGLPLEFPTISLGEVMMKPTSMLYRNLMAMDVEEMIRANPIDGVVLLSGCDKTTPAQLMGAASADVPAIMVTGGPMLTARWRGEELGSGTDAFRLWDAVRSGELSEDEFLEAENHFARSAGHCMVMGTASTMAAMAEAMGMTLPGCACIPAADSRRLAIAEASGREIVSMVHADIRPSKIVTGDAIENAIRVDMAIGGSTNAVVHLLALAGRLGLRLELDDFDRLSRSTPCIVDLKPSGERYMEDLYYAGGIPAVMREIQALLHLSSLAVNGKSLGDNIANAEIFDESVIRSRNTPLFSEGGTVVLRGNLAPQGAVLKQTAASRHLLHHRGKALVFNDRADMYQRIDSLDLPVTKDSVLVLKHAGPLGGPGMPEWGNLPVPQKLLDIGVKDVVRISDGRMSGTAFGTVVLHIAPESAIGGPLAYVQDGDFISLDVANRRLDLEVEDDEFARRRASWRPEQPQYLRGYGRLFLDHVLQADRGCDFDFLVNDGIDNARDDAVYFAELGSRQSSRQ
ncbi:MAG: dihydroxy-acid dehydratase [Anaerolineales bacterium]|nr:dihydroxy-acid dehydratase [Anaerolineales bacterium]